MHIFCISVQKSLLAAVMFGFRQFLQVCNDGLNAVLKLNFGVIGVVSHVSTAGLDLNTVYLGDYVTGVNSKIGQNTFVKVQKS